MKKEKSDRKFISTFVSGGDSSLVVKMKKDTHMLIGSGEHASFGTIGKIKSKVFIKNISIFFRRGLFAINLIK